ncbi:MAG TPA: hypothetical protein VHF22_03890 [Planctomycetota bacterium]|nr:hypothetical protein [Planctomycetota bacterium]
MRFADIVELLQEGDPETIRAAAMMLHATHEALPAAAEAWATFTRGSIFNKPHAQLKAELHALSETAASLRTRLLTAQSWLVREGNSRAPATLPLPELDPSIRFRRALASVLLEEELDVDERADRERLVDELLEALGRA